MMRYDGFFWVTIINLIIGLAVIVGLVLLIVWAVRRMNGTHSASASATTPAQSAKEILKIRYAKGEVTQEEYQKMLSDLDR
jgi:putative membrane protein